MKKILFFYLVIVLLSIGCETTGSHSRSGPVYRPATPPPSEIIRATGIGHPPADTINPQQADLLARENAKTLAYRELNRKIQTVPVQGGQTVEQRLARNPKIRANIENVLQNAKILLERKEKDGSWTVEISIRYSDLKSACQ